MLIRKGISSSIIFCLSEAAGPLVALYRLGLISLVISNDTDFIGLGVDNVLFLLKCTDQDASLCGRLYLKSRMIAKHDFLNRYDNLLHLFLLGGCDYFKTRNVGLKTVLSYFETLGNSVFDPVLFLQGHHVDDRGIQYYNELFEYQTAQYVLVLYQEIYLIRILNALNGGQVRYLRSVHCQQIWIGYRYCFWRSAIENFRKSEITRGSQTHQMHHVFATGKLHSN